MKVFRALLALGLAIAGACGVALVGPAAPARAVDQLTQLTSFYNANDASKGYVDLSQSGTSTITIAATTTTGASMALLSLELTPASQASAIAAATAAGRSQATWMKNSPLGVMYQWGQWGAYPNGTEPAWPTVYANANF